MNYYNMYLKLKRFRKDFSKIYLWQELQTILKFYLKSTDKTKSILQQ